MAERLTADELVARLDVSSDDLAAFRKAGLKAVRTKSGDRFGWPASLHWYVRYRELSALQQLPDTVSQAQFAELTGKTAKTIFNWRRSGMPSRPNTRDNRHPLIPLADAVRWIVIRAEAKPEKAEGERDLVKADRERIARDRDQLRFDRECGSVIDMEFAKRELEELVHATLSVLDGIPARVDEELAVIADPREVRRVLERELASTREEWSEAVVKVAERVENTLTGDDDEEVDASSEAAAASDVDEPVDAP